MWLMSLGERPDKQVQYGQVAQGPAPSFNNAPWLNFHGLMVIGGAAFLVMILTNWGAQHYASSVFTDSTANEISKWVKMVASWLTGLIYIWILIAEKCLNKTGG